MNKFHRFLSLVLCLTFLLSFLFSPIRASAITVSPDPYASTAYAVVGGVVVEGFKEGSKLIASAILSVWNTVVTKDFLNTCQGVFEIGGFFTSPSSYRGIYDSYSEGEKTAGQMVLSKAFLSSVAAAYKTKTGQTLTVPDEEVTIHVPPESVWSEAELITTDRLNYRGFSDLTEVNQNILAGNQIVWQLKKDLNGLELYLRTDFVEALTSEISAVTSKLNSVNNNVAALIQKLDVPLSDLDISVNSVRTTLHQDIVNLNSVYSSFGNEMLSKLDILNDSLEDLDTSSLSGDFLNLYNLIAQNDALTINALQNLPGQISDSISSYFETQSLLLESISDKLGAESSYLFDLVSDMQILRDEVVNGFADTVVALDQIDVSADINLQPLIDQLFDTEATFVGEFSSLYSLINDNIAAYSAANNEFLASIESLLVDNWDQMIIDYSEAIIEQLVYLDLFNWEQLFPGIESLLDSSFSSLVSELDALISPLYDSIDSLTIPLYDLFNVVNVDVLGSLSEIKTSLQSIAGTTTADPGIGDDDSEDEANKQKIPLIPHINNGFQQGENYIGNVYTFLDDELAGFRVAALIFEEFAGISFFYKLIITSCSVGLIATLLGMALNVQSYSVSQRRREEAAQVKASNRMQRSYAA